jgi:hypothetical protein
MQLVEKIIHADHKTDFKTRYIKYRAGRLKHQYWLWNRKSQNKIVDEYDACILKNCQAGTTAFFASAGYYLKDIWPEIDSIETHSVVSEFYPDAIICTDRDDLVSIVPRKYDNFACVNSRIGIQPLETFALHLEQYTKVMNEGGRLFFSYRDTQIQYNRLTVDHYQYFLNWAQSLHSIGLTLVWHDIQFRKKETDGNGNYDGLENPDTTNGNLKFWFVYKGQSWTPLF